MQIENSYQEHDFTKFEKYVDSKSVVSGMLDKTLNEITSPRTGASEGEMLGANFGKGLVNLLRPQLEELWSQQIRKLVETGKIQGEKENKGLDELWNKSDTVSFRGIKEIRKDGMVSTISLSFYQPRFDTTLVIDVKMRDKGSYWQLFDVSNVLEYGKTIEALEEKRVDKLNEAVLSRFFKHVRLSEVKVHTRRLGYYTSWHEHTYIIDFENISKKDISAITCFFDIRNATGEKLQSDFFSERIDLKPNEKYAHRVQDIMSYKKIDPNGLTLDIKHVNLSFSDGEKLEWQYKWADLRKED